ncbi:hypothetical protein BGX34_001500 [Mortierella sp. NVP85]|nr:hypothetical protein BGX34_001500 [Mortierella sp. NVP85]
MSYNGNEFNPSSLKDEISFKKFFTLSDDLELRSVEARGPTAMKFRIFDTPGLNDTNENDIRNIARTFSALSTVDHLNLIIIMDSHHVPLTSSQKAAFKAYFDLFEELKGLIVVVHTHAPNQHRIPGLNTRLDNKLKKRSEFFHQIMGREVPTKRIDCDPEEEGLAHLCMRRNSIREILEMATIKAPVARETTLVRKIPIMTAVDDKLYKKYMDKLIPILELCKSESDWLKVDIEFTEWEIRAFEEHVREHDTDELIPIFEKRFDEEVNFFGWFKDYFGGRADQEHTMEFPQQESQQKSQEEPQQKSQEEPQQKSQEEPQEMLTIDHISVVQQSIDVQDESGGQGHKFWSVRFKRIACKSGYYHVVLSVYKRTMHQKDIEKWKNSLNHCNERLEAHKNRLEVLKGIVEHDTSDPTVKSCNPSLFDQLWNQAIGYRKIMDLMAAKTLSLDLFLELVDGGIYQGGDTDHQVQALEGLLAKKFGIERVP